jgi:purine-nucleoside phosphorylase
VNALSHSDASAPGTAARAAEIVRARRPDAYRAAIVLGSGLGSFADTVEDAVRIPYGELPGFPAAGVSGHAGALVCGRIKGLPVLVLAGRAHFYEHGEAAVMRPALETLAALGVGTLVLTNAAGSVRTEMPPGSLMAIADHLAVSGVNPLIGEPSDKRFVNMVDAYDPALRTRLAACAARLGIPLHHGVYAWFSGPSFETPAEIRMARTLGADAVGMSTVPEVILARFLGLQVAAISTITNLGAGMAPHGPSHGETKEVAGAAAGRLSALLAGFLADLAGDAP